MENAEDLDIVMLMYNPLEYINRICIYYIIECIILELLKR